METVEMENSPCVSIVFICWNRKDEVLKTLADISQITYLDLETIIIDNGSTDGTLEAITSSFPHVLTTGLPTNIGIGAYNIGFEKAKGKYILILDDDSSPSPDAITCAVAHLEQHPKSAAVAFRIKEKNTYTTWLRRLMQDTPQTLPAFVGCGALVRTDVFRNVGYYSETFFLYENELDSALKMINEGYSIDYLPTALAYHRRAVAGRGAQPVAVTAGWRNIYYSLKNRLMLYTRFFPLDKCIYYYAYDLIFFALLALRIRQPLAYFKALGSVLMQLPAYRKEYTKKVNRHEVIKHMAPFFEYYTFSNLIKRSFPKS